MVPYRVVDDESGFRLEPDHTPGLGDGVTEPKLTRVAYNGTACPIMDLGNGMTGHFHPVTGHLMMISQVAEVPEVVRPEPSRN